VGGLAASEEDIAALCWRMNAMRYFQFELLEWQGKRSGGRPQGQQRGSPGQQQP